MNVPDLLLVKVYLSLPFLDFDLLWIKEIEPASTNPIASFTRFN